MLVQAKKMFYFTVLLNYFTTFAKSKILNSIIGMTDTVVSFIV